MGRTKSIEEFLDDRGANWVEEQDQRIVTDYGDPLDEYGAVSEEGLALIERGARDTLVINGPETIPWLQGLVTNDLHELVEEGSGHRNAVVNSTGRFVGETRLLHLPELLLLDLECGNLSDGLYSHLKGQIILEDVELSDKSDTTWRIGLYGDRAVEVVEELADWRHDISERAPLSGSWARWNGADLIAQRMVWMEHDGFEISCDVEVATELLEALDDIAGDLPLIGRRAFEIHRIEAGIPRYGVELDDGVIPLEAGFEDAIAYDKGCYLGQEIIARLDSRGTPAKLLRRLVLDGDDVPEPGTSVYPGDGAERSAGEVKSAVMSPKFGAPVALAFVKRNHNDIGERVAVGDATARIEPLFDMAEIA